MQEAEWPLRVCSREQLLVNGGNVGVVGRWGTGKTYLLRTVETDLRSTGWDVVSVGGTKAFDLGQLEPSEGQVVLVDDADQLAAPGHQELDRLLQQPGVGVVVGWNPARRALGVPAMAWRRRLSFVEHLEPLSVDQVEAMFAAAGLPGFGCEVTRWCAGNRTLVEMCLSRAISIRPTEPTQLWSHLVRAGAAEELVDRVLCIPWSDPEAVVKVLRLLAVAGGEATLLEAPFASSHNIERYQDAFDELQRQGLTDAEQLVLQPPLLAEAMKKSMPLADYDAVHRSMAHALEERGYDIATVASCLTQVRVVAPGWEWDTVRRALDVHLAVGDTSGAVACLKKLVGTDRTQENAELLILLGVLLSRNSPAAGNVYLDLALATGRASEPAQVVRHQVRNQAAVGSLHHSRALLSERGGTGPSELAGVALLDFLLTGALGTCNGAACTVETPLSSTLHALHLLKSRQAAEARTLLRAPAHGSEGEDPLGFLLPLRAIAMEWAGMSSASHAFLTGLQQRATERGQQFEEFLTVAVLAWLELRHLHLPQAQQRLAQAEARMETLGSTWHTAHQLLQHRLRVYSGDPAEPPLSENELPMFLTAVRSESQLYAEALSGHPVTHTTWVEAMRHGFLGTPVWDADDPGATTAALDKDHLRDALTHARRHGVVGRRVPLNVAAAMEYKRRGDTPAARRYLLDAIDRASREGADTLTEHLRTQLASLAAGQVDQLTAMEEQTATLAGRGLTNKQIAQELYVSLRTVETHLTHVYRKLGISGRGEVARALGLDGRHQSS